MKSPVDETNHSMKKRQPGKADLRSLPFGLFFLRRRHPEHLGKRLDDLRRIGFIRIDQSKVRDHLPLLGDQNRDRHLIVEAVRLRPVLSLQADVDRHLQVERILGPLEERLRLFLIQRFGGPTTYSDQRGHPRLRMRHAPFRVDERARNRWVDLMDQALIEANFPEETLPLLRKYFLDTATFMINYAPSDGPNRLGLRG